MCCVGSTEIHVETVKRVGVLPKWLTKEVSFNGSKRTFYHFRLVCIYIHDTRNEYWIVAFASFLKRSVFSPPRIKQATWLGKQASYVVLLKTEKIQILLLPVFSSKTFSKTFTGAKMRELAPKIGLKIRLFSEFSAKTARLFSKMRGFYSGPSALYTTFPLWLLYLYAHVIHWPECKRCFFFENQHRAIPR